MPKSFSTVSVHLVFSTKERIPFLRDNDLREQMHAWLAGVSRKNDCPPTKIGGTADHVHLLCRLGRTVSISEWVKELKRVSNVWARRKNTSMTDFAWQRGYGIFSVSESNINRVKNYLIRQEEHHQKLSFQDEYRKLLLKHGWDGDERFIWD